MTDDEALSDLAPCSQTFDHLDYSDHAPLHGNYVSSDIQDAFQDSYLQGCVNPNDIFFKPSVGALT